MEFWELFIVAAMPVVQVLIVTVLGAILASEYCNLLVTDARRSMNKIVFAVFTPSLMFASLARSVTLEDIISWWFMPVNIGLIVLIGAMVGWLVVKILRPELYLEGLIVACCSSGNFGNLLLIVIPAICNQDGSPFGDPSICRVHALSYASFSMALGGIFTWTYTYSLVENAATLYNQNRSMNEKTAKIPNRESDVGGQTSLLIEREDSGSSHDHVAVSLPSSIEVEAAATENRLIALPSSDGNQSVHMMTFSEKLREVVHRVFHVVKAPPTVAMIAGFIFGATPRLNSLIVGPDAPFRVVQDSITLLGCVVASISIISAVHMRDSPDPSNRRRKAGHTHITKMLTQCRDGTLPCITLILGGNLYQGFSAGRLKTTIIIAVITVRYLILPMIGVTVIKAASDLGFLSQDPLYHYVLMIQFTVPPAINIGTMTQLFDVGQDECAIIMFWTYLVSALAITLWSTIFMWILS